MALVVSLSAVPAIGAEQAIPTAATADVSTAEATASLTPQQFRRLLRFIQTEPLARAQAARDRYAPRTGPPNLRLLDAVLTARRGDAATAERELRALLAEDADRRLVRFELVRVLMLRERFTAARFQLKQLIGTEENREVRRTLVALDREISRRRPWDVNVSITAAPSTNSNRGSSEEVYDANGQVFTIDEDSRARAGVGIGYAASAERRFALNEANALHVRAFTSGRVYEDERLSTAQLGGGAFLRHLFAVDRKTERRLGAFLGPGASIDLGADIARSFVSGSLFDGDVNAEIVSPFVRISTPLMGKLSGSAKLTQAYVNFGDTALADGWRTKLSGSVTYGFRPGLSLTAFGGAEWERAGRDHTQYDGSHVGLSAYIELPRLVSLSVSGSIAQRDFRADFPGNLFARRDQSWRISADLTKADWAIAGFAPRLRVSHEEQRSNVSFYTFTDTGAALGLTRAF